MVTLLAACQVKEELKIVPIEFKNILILGNSITKHSPRPQVGWYGNWGMAASVQSKDFSHIIGTALKAQIAPVNISDFEMSHAVFDLKNLDKYFVQTPDLIIIKIGENVLQTTDGDIIPVSTLYTWTVVNSAIISGESNIANPSASFSSGILSHSQNSFHI